MAHGINSPWLHQAGDRWNSYSSRYSADWHCDLIEQLSYYGASARVKLNEVCSIFGLPGKFGVDGSKVSEMIEAERNDQPHLGAFLDAWGQSSNNQFTMETNDR
jgi:predicted PolB exonuclease-like 3'-5' exonuclease